jgi:D-glycero-alpha-D-manno-heptose-7-phosphate kinase
MILTKTPLRISFFGGGSDIPQYYENNEGLVVSTTINQHIYIASNFCVADHIKLVYSKMEYPKTIDDIEHDRIKEILKHYDIKNNIEIASFSDVPTKGTGLGSSSTFTVGLINALHYMKYNCALSPAMLAELSSYIEIDRCKQPIGKQDQYAAAYGGLNCFIFNKYDVEVKPIEINFFTKQNLNQRLFFVNTKTDRFASDILAEQVQNLSENKKVSDVSILVDMAEKSISYLQQNKLDDFGSLLHESWKVKKTLSTNITNPLLDEIYDYGLKSGALGGKLLGAGGGGYFMFYVPEQNQNKFLDLFSNKNLVKFKFTDKGSSIEMCS